MRYSKIHKLDITNGEGIGVALFVQGCHFHCENCFNQNTWDFEGGKEFTLNTRQQLIQLISNPHITRFTILGGEPLTDENVFGVLDMICEVKERFENDKKIWVYTGYKLEQLLNDKSNPCDKARQMILEKADVLIDGQYIDKLKNLTLKFRGSLNQRVIDLKKTLAANKVVLYTK